MFTLASEETYQDGQIIFKEGSSGDWIYVILSGSVEISKMAKGKKAVVEVLKQGEIFGELSFLGGIKRSATAQAIGETTIGLIDRDYMDQQFNNLSSEFRSILSALVKRFRSMIDMAYESPSQREPSAQRKTLSLSYKDGKSFAKAYASNISSGGLFIRTEKPLKQGEKLLLKLQLPSLSEPMKIDCEVAWARKQEGDTDRSPPGMVVKFCEMTKKDNQILKQYIKEIMKG